MELTIQKKEDKPLLQAQDLHAERTYEGTTPSRKEPAQLIAEKTKTKLEHVIVRKIQGVFGHQKAHIQATIYQDSKLLEKVENQPLIQRHKGKEAKQEGEAKDEVKPAEAKTETPKEALAKKSE